MNSIRSHRLIANYFVIVLIGIGTSSVSQSQEPNILNQLTKKLSDADVVAAKAKAIEALKKDEGTWEVAVTFWPRPGSPPVTSAAAVNARMDLGGTYLEQRFDGTFGPEMGNRTWTSLSFTNFNSSTGQYESVRMASSGAPMFVVRGKGSIEDGKGLVMELSGEYELMGAKAIERDIIRHDGPDKCVIESWMTFGGTAEFKGAEMVLTRVVKTPKPSEGPLDSALRLGNFSVSLVVKDLPLSRAFYEKLGFRSIAGNAKNYLIMQNESSTVGLFQGLLEKNILTFNPGWDRTGATLSEFDDVRHIQSVLKSRGTLLDTSADETSTGPASITLHDPDGNQILLDQHVPRPKK